MTDALPDPHADHDLIVIGGGIAGLVVALETALAGLRVVLIEESDGTGGLLRRGTIAGIGVDLGAESFATRTDGVAALIADHGLDLTVAAPRPGGAFLVAPDRFGRGRFGRVDRMPLPRRTVIGMPADPSAPDIVRILGTRGARRAAAERTMPIAQGPEPSLAELVTSRFGALVAQRLVDPLCQSVYSQPSTHARLSLLHPTMWEAFHRLGSLTAAADALAPSARTGAAIGGIEGGMWRLADAVRQAAITAGVEIRTAVRARGIRRTGGVSEVTTDDGVLRATEAVIATGPAGARALLEGATSTSIATSPSTLTSESATPDVLLVTAAITARGLDARPVGSGVIVAPAVRTEAKAMTHIDAKWPWAEAALPTGTHLVRLSARSTDAEAFDTPEVVARNVQRLTGITVRPADIGDIVRTTWTDAVVPAGSAPITTDIPGIRVVGAAASGTGLASVIPHARTVARDIIATRTAQGVHDAHPAA